MKTRKIIASDIDGTLLPYGQEKLDPELFNLIEDFDKKGVLFVPASGRGIRSIKEKFAPVADKISYLSENGSVIWYYDDIIGEFPFPKDLLERVVRTLYRDPNMECFITSARNAYIISDDLERSQKIKHLVNPETHMISADPDAKIMNTLESIPDTIVKATAFCFPGNAALFFDQLREAFGKEIEVAIAGPNVVDFDTAGKGDGLRVLTEYLGLTNKDVFAFGDNYNDITMLEYTPNSYIITTDNPELAKSSSFQTDDPIAELKKIYTELENN